MVAVTRDFVQQGAIDGGHHQAGALGAAVLLGQQGEGFVIDRLGALDLELHQCLEALAVAGVEDVGGGDVELLQFVDGQVDAALAAILADIADDVGELEGQPQLFGKEQGTGLGMAEDAGREHPDHPGHVPAVALQAGIVEVAGLVQVHFHAIDDGLQVFSLELVGRHVRMQGLGDRVRGLAFEHGGDFLAPPHELGAGHHGVLDFIDGVVDLAAKGVQRRDRQPALRRQEQEAVIKTGTAGGGLLLAVFVWRHGCVAGG